MHIGLIIGSMRTGGAERSFYTLANGFSAKGNTTDLVLIKAEGEFISRLAKSVNIIDLNKSHARNAVFNLINYLNINNPDVIIVAQIHIQIIALIAKRFSKWKGKIILNEQSTFSRNVRGSFQKFLAKRLFHSADGIIAVSSESLKDFYSEIPLLKIKSSIIPNPVLRDEIFLLKNEHPDQLFFLNKNYPVIVAAGRLTSSKNYRLLIDAIMLVRRIIPAKLIILGEGEERKALQNYISENDLDDSVSLPGNIPNPYSYMNCCDVFVLSSDYEGLPSVLIEALGCGCKVVSTDCKSGPAEILENGKYGTLVPIGNASALANAIIDSLQRKKNEEESLVHLDKYKSEPVIQSYLRFIKLVCE